MPPSPLIAFVTTCKGRTQHLELTLPQNLSDNASSPPSPLIAFVTTCKGRTQHLELTLPQNLSDNARYPHSKFIILDYASPDHLVPYLKRSHLPAIQSGLLTLYRYSPSIPTPFRMAHAKNMAHRLGILEGADILVNLDADNFTGLDFASYIVEKFTEQDIFLWARMVKSGEGKLPRGISGRIAVSSKAFLASGGYDEKYETWSPDDKDFNARLRRLGYIAHEIAPRYLSGVLHNDKMRFHEYPHAQAGMGSEEFDAVNYQDHTIANWGNIGCGEVTRNFSTSLISLSPLPTRIFGIGMHKTGTTSLHTALQILGFDSAHWKSAHWAKAIWLEMLAHDKSRTLERHYALSDLPIGLLYDRLDLAYPGSKFILTTRSEESWLKSVESHWSYSQNPFRAAWDTDPFTHKIHWELYRRKTFDSAAFLARFLRHNTEVMEYFKSRPNDLLVMDITSGAGWKELCPFLGKPIPSIPYPRAFATNGNTEGRGRK